MGIHGFPFAVMGAVAEGRQDFSVPGNGSSAASSTAGGPDDGTAMPAASVPLAPPLDEAIVQDSAGNV